MTMGTLKQPTMIIGEGVTEFYYFNSLKNRMRSVQIEPTIPKHSSLKELERKIEEGVASGYAKILCVIDMDTKNNATEIAHYERLRKKYAIPINKPRKGIHCEVKFYETHRCTELFFLFYFVYTSKLYDTQDVLIKDINIHCEYRKEEAFFKKCKGLHTFFEKNGGSLDVAIKNADCSMKEREQTGRSFTYSELGKMMKELMNTENKK